MSAFPSLPVRLLIASTPAHLPLVRSALERLCELVGFDETARGDIVLAVDEALTNVIKHAYHGAADKPIEVTLRPVLEAPGREALEIELRDWGAQAPPETIKSRDLGDVRPGGLGVHIMNCCMDGVRYTAMPGGGTRLTLTKALKARSGS